MNKKAKGDGETILPDRNYAPGSHDNAASSYESLHLGNRGTTETVYDEYRNNRSLPTHGQVPNETCFCFTLTIKRVLVFGCFITIFMVLLSNVITGIFVFRMSQASLQNLEETLQQYDSSWSLWSEWSGCPKCNCYNNNTQSRSRKCRMLLPEATSDSGCKGLSIDLSDCCNTNCSFEVPIWSLMFRGIPNVGTDVYDAWLDSNYTITDKYENGPSSHWKHYRNPLIDHWENLSIIKAKYSLFKDGNEAAYLIFSAVESDNLSWFTQANIIESSWTDITTHGSLNFCSIYGHNPGRRFFVSISYSGGCPTDKSYTVALTMKGHSCTYDNHLKYPQFLYANGSTYGRPENMINFDIADYMEVSVLG